MGHRATLQILSGGSRSGKTAAALAEYLEVVGSGPLSGRRRALWLTPTQAAAADIRNRLIRKAPNGIPVLGAPSHRKASTTLIRSTGMFWSVAECHMTMRTRL